MPFINEILKYSNLSIVGLEKNTGKTECLNYILRNIHCKGKKIAVTSVGIDGETIDQVTRTQKPEITLFSNMFFVTSEKHYREKHVTSKIIDILDISTPIGRLVVAETLDQGKVQLSGPSDTTNLKSVIRYLKNLDTDLCMVDGALSRLSLAAPTVTDAMILSTGAALSANIPQLVRYTMYVVDRINLQQVNNQLHNTLSSISSGLWAVPDMNKSDIVPPLNIDSVLALSKSKEDIFRYGSNIYIPGMISDKVLLMLKSQKNIADITLIIKDFTKIFAQPETYYAFMAKGGKIMVVDKPNLIAITVNPWSPSGYLLNSNELISQLQAKTDIPVYNIKA